MAEPREIWGLVPLLSGSFSAGLDRGAQDLRPTEVPLKDTAFLFNLSYVCVVEILVCFLFL